MRIWYVADTRLPGQAANTVQVMKMSAAFAGCGQDVTLLARFGPDRRDETLFDFYAVPRTFRLARAPRLVPGRSRSDRWNVPFTLSVLPYLKLYARRFDLVYTRLPFLASLAARLGLRVALESHRLLPTDGWASRRVVAGFVRNSARPAFAGLVGISQVLCDWYVEAGIPKEKVLVAHDGVDLERFEPALTKEQARAKLVLPAGQPIVCYCGHLYTGRGVEELLACASDMPDTLFLFVGGSDQDVRRHRDDAAHRRLVNVRFLGFKPIGELPAYLFAADALAMPYTKQTGSAAFMSPMKMFEYLAAGRPIIASDFPSVREVLKDGHNAILVQPGDPASLQQGLRRALTDARYIALGQHALQDARQHTWKRRAERVLEFLARRR